MAVYISGGSNSLRTEGWVSRFIDRAGSQAEIHNISIGASPSMMGAFRSLNTVSMNAGDTLLWEYGINDELHIDLRGYDPVELVNAVEWLLIGCREARIKFVALVFHTRRRQLNPKDCPYPTLLKELFTHYGVPFFDVGDEFLRRRPNKNGVQKGHYADHAHYDPTSGIMNLIAKGGYEMLDQACVPQDVSARTDGRLQVYDQFTGGEATRFENSAISLKVWNPGVDGLTGVFSEPGRVVGVVLVSTSAGGVMDFSLGDQCYRLSTTFQERNYNKPMVKFISLPTLTGHPIAFEAGETFAIRWADRAEGALADLKFNPAPNADIVNARESRIAAVLVENRVKV